MQVEQERGGAKALVLLRAAKEVRAGGDPLLQRLGRLVGSS